MPIFVRGSFQLKVHEDGGVERTGKAKKAVKLGRAGSGRVQEFFDNLSERYIRDEPLLIRDTTKAELAYISARAEEAALAWEADGVGTVEDEADTAAEEKELAEWVGSAGEASGVGAGAPLVEDVVEESTGEETKVDDSSPRTARRQQAKAQPVRQTRAAAAKKKAAAATSSSSKRRRTPSPSPPPSDSDLEADFDLGSFNPKRKRRLAEEEDDTETLAQRVVNRAKASTGDKPPASTSRTPEVVEISPDAGPRCSPRFSPQHPPSMDQEDIDIVIGEVAKDAEAKAVRIAAEEAAKSATGEAREGLAGEAGKATAKEAEKAAAEKAARAAFGEAAKKPVEEELANDQPSSPAAPTPPKYLKVGDHLFVRLPGTADTRAPAKGEVFDDEALATAGLQIVDEPSTSSGGPQEEELLRAMGAVGAAQGELDERKRELILKQADIDKAQEVVKEQAAKDEAAWQQQQALLNSQDEDLAAREQALAATLRGKDEEIREIVAQWTQELEQRHKEALDAQALVHIGKVKELELEWEELKKKVSTLTEERDTANRTLVDAQVAISDKAKLLSEANDSINDLKLKLDGLKGKLLEAGACEETLNKALEDEKRLRRDDVAEHKEYAKSVNLWISRLIDVAGRITMKLAVMGMPNVRYSGEPNVSPNARLTLFFEGVLDALEQLRSNRAVYLANESRRLCRGALTKVLTKVAFWSPNVDFADALESLPEGTNLAALEELLLK
nr:AF4/FMR2 family member 1-like [Aegilops tauschii subsp. strangulata]